MEKPNRNYPRDSRVYGRNPGQKTIYFDEITMDQIKAYAARSNQSFSSAVRDLIEWAIEDHLKGDK